MNAPAAITVTPFCVADLFAEGERMPLYVHVIDHPDTRVLVDTGALWRPGLVWPGSLLTRIDVRRYIDGRRCE